MVNQKDYIKNGYGYCFYVINPECFIYNLYVYAEYRRQGHATKLLHTTIREIRKTGYSGEIKISNINYLFIRVITIEFLLISSILFFVEKDIYYGIISFVIFLIFLWRSRGLARGLVFKTILLNLKK